MGGPAKCAHSQAFFRCTAHPREQMQVIRANPGRSQFNDRALILPATAAAKGFLDAEVLYFPSTSRATSIEKPPELH